MKRRNLIFLCILSVVAGAIITGTTLSFVWAQPAAAAAAAKTLDNLQAAYNGESNANARYIAFAEKADKEGYGQVASLFRAAAKSESVHASGLSKAIKELKAEPKADLKKPDVKSTKENLAAALKGESYESEKMYPGFIKQAEADKNTFAGKVFHGAQMAEIEHAKFYKEALSNLDGWKKGTKDFLVCTVCGYTTVDMKLKKCPVCSVPRNKFDTVK